MSLLSKLLLLEMALDLFSWRGSGSTGEGSLCSRIGHSQPWWLSSSLYEAMPHRTSGENMIGLSPPDWETLAQVIQQ